MLICSISFLFCGILSYVFLARLESTALLKNLLDIRIRILARNIKKRMLLLDSIGLSAILFQTIPD